MRYRCNGCDFEGDEDVFEPAEDLSMRLTPGYPNTDLQCPDEDCGRLQSGLRGRFMLTSGPVSVIILATIKRGAEGPGPMKRPATW